MVTRPQSYREKSIPNDQLGSLVCLFNIIQLTSLKPLPVYFGWPATFAGRFTIVSWMGHFSFIVFIYTSSFSHSPLSLFLTAT